MPSERSYWTDVYARWVASWEAALAAITSAAQGRMFSQSEAAAHTSLVRAEREAVTRYFDAAANGR